MAAASRSEWPRSQCREGTHGNPDADRPTAGRAGAAGTGMRSPGSGVTNDDGGSAAR